MSYTYTRVGAILHEIGMVSEEKMRSVLLEAAGYADNEMSQYSAACALEEFGVAISVHADDIDSIYHDYASLLESAAEVAGRKAAITNVRLVEGEGDFESGRYDRVEFERDGELVSIEAEHFAEDYFDHSAACDAIAETAHAGDPRSWHYVGFERKPSSVYDSIMVLATPEQVRALQAQLGFIFHVEG